MVSCGVAGVLDPSFINCHTCEYLRYFRVISICVHDQFKNMSRTLWGGACALMLCCGAYGVFLLDLPGLRVRVAFHEMFHKINIYVHYIYRWCVCVLSCGQVVCTGAVLHDLSQLLICVVLQARFMRMSPGLQDTLGVVCMLSRGVVGCTGASYWNSQNGEYVLCLRIIPV